MLIPMKAIQITVDEALLQRLDRCQEVRSRGRSAVFREAVDAYLAKREAEEITQAYLAAYGPGTPPDELEGWADEDVWPE